MAQKVKNLPAVQETGIWSLGGEDPLEKGMATHSSIFAGKIPWIEEPGGLKPMESQRVEHDWETEQTQTPGINLDLCTNAARQNGHKHVHYY